MAVSTDNILAGQFLSNVSSFGTRSPFPHTRRNCLMRVLHSRPARLLNLILWQQTVTPPQVHRKSHQFPHYLTTTTQSACSEKAYGRSMTMHQVRTRMCDLLSMANKQSVAMNTIHCE